MEVVSRHALIVSVTELVDGWLVKRPVFELLHNGFDIHRIAQVIAMVQELSQFTKRRRKVEVNQKCELWDRSNCAHYLSHTLDL